MRLKPHREPDLFERPPDRHPIPRERREAMVEILRALLTEALSDEAAIPIGSRLNMSPARRSSTSDSPRSIR